MNVLNISIFVFKYNQVFAVSQLAMSSYSRFKKKNWLFTFWIFLAKNLLIHDKNETKHDRFLIYEGDIMVKIVQKKKALLC